MGGSLHVQLSRQLDQPLQIFRPGDHLWRCALCTVLCQLSSPKDTPRGVHRLLGRNITETRDLQEVLFEEKPGFSDSLLRLRLLATSEEGNGQSQVVDHGIVSLLDLLELGGEAGHLGVQGRDLAAVLLATDPTEAEERSDSRPQATENGRSDRGRTTHWELLL